MQVRAYMSDGRRSNFVASRYVKLLLIHYSPKSTSGAISGTHFSSTRHCCKGQLIR
jgi:hypothetical protein